MIEIYVNDWMTSMGAVALMRLDPKKQAIQSEANCIKIPSEWIEEIPNLLFEYMVSYYSVAEREFEALKKLTSSLMKRAHDQTKYKENMKWVNDRVKNSIDKIKKYFPECTDECDQITNQLKEAMKDQEFEKVKNGLQTFYQLINRKEINQKLTLNFVKSNALLAQSGGQTSFLNVAKNSLNYKEQMELFRQDYINPLLWEIQLRNHFELGNEEQIEELFKVEDKPSYATSWLSAKKKSKQSWCEWLKELPECTLISGQWGTMLFEEMYFVPLGMSMKNTYNYAWEGNLETFQSISSLGKLLLLLSPLGSQSYKRPFKGEQLTVFGFLYDQSSCENTLFLNNQFANAIRKDVRFSQALSDTFSKVKALESKRKQSSMLIEWMTEYKTKKTVLEYRPLHPSFVQYVLSDQSSVTAKIFPVTFREEVVRAAMDNVDSKHIIWREMRRVMQESDLRRHTGSLRNALQMREKLIYLREGNKLTNEKTLTDQMYNLGYRLSKTLHSDGKDDESGVYRASASKKMTSVAYRLMNAAKAGNRQLFMDTAMRLHVTAGMSISPIFIRAIDPKTSDSEFATIAMAFIAGLIPSANEQQNQDDNQKQVHE